MDNLFICATPYHIILACGICKNRFKKNSNTILIYQNFKMDNLSLTNIKMIFNNVIILDGELEKKKFKYLQRIELNKNILKEIDKKILSYQYKNIFIYNDNTLETQYILNKVSKLNLNCNFIGVEDGSSVYNGMKVKNKNIF